MAIKFVDIEPEDEKRQRSGKADALAVKRWFGFAALDTTQERLKSVVAKR